MLFYTTCGWMMWNWMASSLFAGATVVTYDGFAAYPKLSSPWDLVEKEGITHVGSSPRYFQACRKRVRPMDDNDLSALRVIYSTGSPLSPEDYEYVYGKVVRRDARVDPGGTDICSCFALGNPTPSSSRRALPRPRPRRRGDGPRHRDSLSARRPSSSARRCSSPPPSASSATTMPSPYRGAYFEKNDVWYAPARPTADRAAPSSARAATPTLTPRLLPRFL